MKNEIEIGINAPFDLDHFNENKSDDVIKSLKKIKSITCLYKSDLNNKDKFDIVNLYFVYKFIILIIFIYCIFF